MEIALIVVIILSIFWGIVMATTLVFLIMLLISCFGVNIKVHNKNVKTK